MVWPIVIRRSCPVVNVSGSPLRGRSPIEPKMLLLDEPLSALDKKLREEMQVELRQIQKKVGITTLFVTHDQEEALALADASS